MIWGNVIIAVILFVLVSGIMGLFGALMASAMVALFEKRLTYKQFLFSCAGMAILYIIGVYFGTVFIDMPFYVPVGG